MPTPPDAPQTSRSVAVRTDNRSDALRKIMETLPQFGMESVETNEISSTAGFADPVSVTSLLLLLVYLARSSLPSAFQPLLDGSLFGVNVSPTLKSRTSDEDEWWQFPVHMIALWQMRSDDDMQSCARRIVCEQVTAGNGDPFFDFAVGGVAYMMGATGSLSMVDKLQALEDGPVDCSRMVPECSTPKLRDSKGLGVTVRKFTSVLADWLEWW